MSEVELVRESPVNNSGIKKEELISTPLYKNFSFIILSVLFLIALIVGTILLNQMNSKIEQQSIDIKKYNDSLQDIQSKQNENTERVDNTSSRIDRVVELQFLSFLQHSIEGGIVTDDFIVDKITFEPVDEAISVVIDLEAQPTMLGVYEGKGIFDLPDRELRAKAMVIIDQIKEVYINSKLSDMPSWDTSIVHLTIQNYKIGQLILGEFKLVGEK